MIKNSVWTLSEGKHRARLIIDNDFCGDPDGLVQLAHHFLSKTVEISFVIGSHLRDGDPFCPVSDTADESASKARALAEMTGRTDVKIIAGSNKAITDHKAGYSNEAAKMIVDEAMRDDTDVPLFVVCGAGLTEIASAWLMKPEIEERLTVVWIGGHEHDGLAVPPPGGTEMEYNQAIDPIAAQVVFNNSRLKIWQVPRNIYRTVLASRDELLLNIASGGKLGGYLYEILGTVNDTGPEYGMPKSETYILGDSPLVLLTSLTSNFEPDTSSSEYTIIPCPKIKDSGLYEYNREGRPLRVYTRLDNRLLIEDFFAKVQLFARTDNE